MLIPIDNINCADRIRAVNPVTVSALAASIREVGLLNPITVSVTTVVRNARAQDGYILIGGLHRLEAAKSLGWIEIEATITELSGPSAVIAECDENLCGTNLSKAERALFTARRKAAYEALHPETKHGGDRREQDPNIGLCSFVDDTAERTGRSRSSVAADASRAKSIARDILDEIKGSAMDTGRNLDALAKMSKDEQREAIVRARDIGLSRKRTVIIAPDPTNDLEAVEKQVAALMRAWNSAGPEAREQFLSRIEGPVFDNTLSGRAA
jgi:ParB family chromosome partitioning protein